MTTKKEIADKIKDQRTTDIMKVVPLSQPTIDRAKRGDMSPMTKWALNIYLRGKYS